MKKILLLLGFVFLPQLVAFAAPTDKILDLIRSAKTVVDLLLQIFFVLAIIYFFYGIGKYILAAGDPEKASEGKSIMIYGAIAIFVMTSVFGISALLRDTFGVGPETNVNIPGFNTNPPTN